VVLLNRGVLLVAQKLLREEKIDRGIKNTPYSAGLWY